MPKIVISRRIFEDAVRKFEALNWDVEHNIEDIAYSKETLIEKLRSADALICLLTDQIDKEVIEAAKNLKIIANVAVGYNNIDVETAKNNQIIVTNTPDVLTEATAELTFALLLATARRVCEAHIYTVAKQYQGWELFQPHLGVDVFGKTLGIVGLGRIGQAVASIAKYGFKMRVLYTDPRSEKRLDDHELAEYVEWEQFLKECDFISIHTPLTEHTRHLFNQASFEQMKNSAIIINTARGPIIDEKALAYALSTGQIRGAGLDVYEFEPQIEPDLLKLKEFICLTPHIGSATKSVREKMCQIASENVLAVLQGKAPLNPV